MPYRGHVPLSSNRIECETGCACCDWAGGAGGVWLGPTAAWPSVMPSAADSVAVRVARLEVVVSRLDCRDDEERGGQGIDGPAAHPRVDRPEGNGDRPAGHGDPRRPPELPS